MNIVIIGNGVAGITAARFIRKRSDHSITVVSDESDHFYSRTALMYLYMGHMTYEDIKPYEDWFWPKNRIDCIRGYVSSVDFESKQLVLSSGDKLPYDRLIIASGSVSRTFGWPGQDLVGVQGLYSLQDLDRMETDTQSINRAVVVGGGLIGIEMAEMLHSRHIPTTFLVREPEYWSNVLPTEEGHMISEHIREHGIDLRLNTNLERILPDESGRVRAVLTDKGEEISCQFVGLTTGVTPNVSFLRESPLNVDIGVVVDDMFRTNIEDVYAIGDCAQFSDPPAGHPPVEQLWYTGRMHGEVVASTVCGEPRNYDRGVWFNSAKFMQIEYQTYGYVANEPQEGIESLYWQDPHHKRAVRINYRADDHCVVGCNVFGIRHSQAVWEEWLRSGATLEHVLENLEAANFDTEFYRMFERHVRTTFADVAGVKVTPRRPKRGVSARMMTLKKKLERAQ
jgi:NAD(P)H-nitrite reductase large subunit